MNIRQILVIIFYLVLAFMLLFLYRKTIVKANSLINKALYMFGVLSALLAVSFIPLFIANNIVAQGVNPPKLYAFTPTIWLITIVIGMTVAWKRYNKH